jgi:hypothetical protein
MLEKPVTFKNLDAEANSAWEESLGLVREINELFYDGGTRLSKDINLIREKLFVLDAVLGYYSELIAVKIDTESEPTVE